LEVEGGRNFVPDLQKTALSEVCSLESGTELLDDNLTTLLRVGNTPEQAVILDRERKIELGNPLFEVLHRDEASLRVERVVEALEAVKEGDSSLLEEANDPARQGRHAPRLGLTEMLFVDFKLSCDLFLVLALELGQRGALRGLTLALLLENRLRPQVLDDLVEGALEVEVLDEVDAEVHFGHAGLISSVDTPAPLDSEYTEAVPLRVSQA
jgi:hypothetical protein